MGALSFRSFSRVEKTIAFREQKVVDGFAAPAVDRAKSKLEYLFTRDDRVVSKRPPSSDDLFTALTAQTAAGPDADPYTLPDETALDITGDGNVDPAWAFEFEDTTVVYSLLVSHERGTVSLSDDSAENKANLLVTRNAPINTAEPNASCPVSRLAGDGWQDAGGNLQKNFQVNVLAIKGSGGPNRTITAAEYQQVRSSPKGNKYGAYFRYDLDISPGFAFRWNGAMHSESNIIAGRNLQAYLVSSPESCIFSADSSEITISEETDINGDGNPDGYKGNLAAGLVRDNQFQANSVRFHNTATVDGGGNVNVGATALATDNDSVDKANNNDLADVFADPVKIFTQDESDPLNAASWDFDKPASGSTFVGGRVRNVSETTRPFLDDGYRADNRYGPKPLYNATNGLDGQLIGTPIPAGRTELSGFDVAGGEYGLDGYWERRAIAEGLRVIVGQRLELGNRFGWGGTDDPLYPPDSVATLSNNSGPVKGAAEAKQQRTLRDNLAAVQGMVAYHYSEDGGQIPYMCMAATVHPGTQQTLINSRTFGTYPGGAQRIDFLTGQGTNGWEFDFATLDSDGDSSVIDEFDYDFSTPANSPPIARALRNLAYFAGDPRGGAPSFEPKQGVKDDPLGSAIDDADEFVHPYPYMAMWGDFSVLRRIFDEYLETGTSYADLSLADQASLHSAACTLGMLANNLETLEEEYKAIIDTRGATWVGNINTNADPNRKFEDWLPLLSGLTAPEREVVELHRQTERDRIFGFRDSDASVIANHTMPAGSVLAGTNVGLTCDPAIEFPASYTIGGTAIDDVQRQALALALCARSTSPPAYPALHYVMPRYEHSQLGDDAAVDVTAVDLITAPVEFINDQTLTGEEYIDEGGAAPIYIADSDATTTKANDSYVYQAVDVEQIALTPAAAIANFKQPVASGADLVAPNDFDSGTDAEIRTSLTQSEIKVGGTVYELAFLDKALLDGRQLMNVRVLDLDIGKLTLDKPFETDTIAWIPEEEGLFYAAREDAVREDSIVRPSQATWATCEVFENLVDNADNCPMVVTSNNAKQFGTYDPPLNTTNSISPKPVDMYADPDRRPNGFRLFNGSNLNRSDDNQAAGISFVTDNPAYIYGDFNLHQNKATGDIIEEFTGMGQILGTAFASEPNENTAQDLFYGRTNLDLNFARGNTDAWRPSEIFADAVTILSPNFRDGWAEDAYVYDLGGGLGAPVVNSSYLNYNRSEVGTAINRWLREDNDQVVQCTGGDTCNYPIRLDRNGISKKWRTGPSVFEDYPVNFGDDYMSLFENRGDLIQERQTNQITPPDNSRVNALLVSGIVPMREDQTYGGIQNFPRLIEYWAGKNLIISGGFFQLNFSTQATAPQDQDAWEPGTAPQAATNYNVFYGAAERIWGYDVGFQYTSVSPIARRFVSVGRPRSEFYRELPLDDAYVQNLCTALQGLDGTVSCQ